MSVYSKNHAVHEVKIKFVPKRDAVSGSRVPLRPVSLRITGNREFPGSKFTVASIKI